MGKSIIKRKIVDMGGRLFDRDWNFEWNVWNMRMKILWTWWGRGWKIADTTVVYRALGTVVSSMYWLWVRGREKDGDILSFRMKTTVEEHKLNLFFYRETILKFCPSESHVIKVDLLFLAGAANSFLRTLQKWQNIACLNDYTSSFHKTSSI